MNQEISVPGVWKQVLGAFFLVCNLANFDIVSFL